MSQADVRLAGVLPLVLSRTQVSSYRVGRWFGPSWDSTVDQRLEVDGAEPVGVVAGGDQQLSGQVRADAGYDDQGGVDRGHQRGDQRVEFGDFGGEVLVAAGQLA